LGGRGSFKKGMRKGKKCERKRKEGENGTSEQRRAKC
jgi:hypothetical protein